MIIRPIIRFFLLFIFFIGLITPLLIVNLFSRKKFFFKLFGPPVYSIGCKILGIHIIEVKGEPSKQLSLAVSNHSSYTDILILGSLEPYSFLSTTDIEKWPFIGWCARAFGGIFVSRKAKDVKKDIVQLKEALVKYNQSFLFFPEGTTNNGTHLLPFKTSYFNGASLVQPISLVYSTINGLPIQGWQKKALSWRGSLALFPHLWNTLKIRCVGVKIIFHTPFSEEKNRKILAKKCFDHIQQGLFL